MEIAWTIIKLFFPIFSQVETLKANLNTIAYTVSYWVEISEHTVVILQSIIMTIALLIGIGASTCDNSLRNSHQSGG